MNSAQSLRASDPNAFVLPDSHSTVVIDQLLRSASSLCNASSAIFFWVGADGEIDAPQTLNITEESIAAYNEGWTHLDPIHTTKLKDQNRQIAVLSQARRDLPSAIDAEYQNCLNRYDVGDEVALLFCRDGSPLASLSLFRKRGQAPFSLDCFDWDALRKLARSSLGLHWRIRAINVADLLADRYGLSARELDVARYVTRGKGNQQIAEILGISLQTVKSHVVSVMDKTGVDSRLGIACLAHRLELTETRLT